MTTAASVTTTRGARRPVMDRTTAMRLARTEYERFAAQLRRLAPEDWSRATCCPPWDVHLMACHVVGMAELAASPLEQLRQMATAARRKGDGPLIDALTELQVDKHRHRTPADVVAQMERVAPRAAAGRRRTPAPLRRVPMGQQPVDDLGTTEPWALGYLVDVILTRDTWMHRSDVAEATGRPMELTADHDGVLVADVVQEWAGRHAQPCTLVLTGPAGGVFRFGEGGPSLELDAVAFCRGVSGRGTGEGLLATRVPF